MSSSLPGTEFVIRDDPRFGQCHAATLLVRAAEVVVAWFAGSREGADDVGIWLSRRENGRWSEPEQVAGGGEPHWNPVLFEPEPGRVLLFYKVGTRIPQWRTLVRESRDGGRTFGAARELVRGDRGGRGPVKNKPIVLSDGTWLAGASVESERWDAFTDRSSDRGMTWKRSTFVPVGSGFSGPGVIQPTLWENEHGQVRMLLRSTAGRVYSSTSDDGGHSWSTTVATELPNNNSGLDAANLGEGTVVLAHNPVGTNWGVRSPLVLSVSEDDGITWRQTVTVDTAEPAELRARDAIVPEETGILTNGAAEFSYPAIVPLPGRAGVALAYTWQRRGIAFAIVGWDRLAKP